MVGVPIGEARLSIECGSTRIPVHIRFRGPVSADALLDVLPTLTKALEQSLQRIAIREAKK
ncbi:hypothetical protein D9V29_11820 [Mycetocola manganoxydans]|uniref:Uncharacterized protein n=1 Tax=Mycetocola manganoxydans TaxID=699879 RepID=A0A3L6ZQP4_9MICO|nr:hypothetical protein D9V29_11820 [Mycetocola manganoxydans]GHD50695.1 hypothetical protein GCM10008097_24920 [Mycetocola manganoxydans]